MRTDYSVAGNDFSPGFPVPRSHRKPNLLFAYTGYAGSSPLTLCGIEPNMRSEDVLAHIYGWPAPGALPGPRKDWLGRNGRGFSCARRKAGTRRRPGVDPAG